MSETYARQPRSLVVVAGQVIPADAGMIGWGIEVNEYQRPDTFGVTFALLHLPAARNAAWWASQASVEVEIFQGYPLNPDKFTTSDLKSLFIGRCDDPTFDWTAGTLMVGGRDLTSRLVDAKTSEKYINSTASEVANKLAAKYGLTPKVTATQAKVGKLYTQDHVDVKTDRTEWDLLTWLAAQEGFDVFVSGRTLHFGPKVEVGAVAPFVVKRQGDGATTSAGNFVALSTTRDYRVAGDVTVTVRSWNSKAKKTFTRTAKKTGSKGEAPQEFTYSVPGLQPDEVQRRADKLLAQVTQFGMGMSFTGPAMEALPINGLVRLEGTGTAFDQDYFPESISRTFDPEDGYSWTVTAKNKPATTESGI